MGKFKNRKIYLSAIILLFISILVYSGSKIFKNINEVKPLDLEVFNPVTDEDKKIDGTDFVTFDAFFLSDEDGDGQAEGYHGISLKNRTSQKIYFELNITGDITLKEGNIEFENNNVNISLSRI